MKDNINQYNESGQRHGVWKNYTLDDAYAIGHYVNGKKEGWWTIHYNSGSRQGYYKRGHEIGWWIGYDAKGNRTLRQSYGNPPEFGNGYSESFNWDGDVVKTYCLM